MRNNLISNPNIITANDFATQQRNFTGQLPFRGADGRDLNVTVTSDQNWVQLFAGVGVNSFRDEVPGCGRIKWRWDAKSIL